MLARIARMTVCGVLLTVAFVPQTSASGPGELPVVRVEASREVVDLLRTWDPNIWFFTPAAQPIASLDSLTREDVKFWGIELLSQAQAFFAILELPGEGVGLMGDGAYNSEGAKPALYVTWASIAPQLQGAAHVEFVGNELTPAANPAQPAGASFKYRGSTKGSGTVTDVSFEFDPAKSEIQNFKSTFTCIEGTGAMGWNCEETITVETDGTFSYTDKYGSSVTGNIAADGTATGELSKPPFSLICESDTAYSPETKWTALQIAE